MLKINTNDRVKVKLNDVGRNVAYYAGYSATALTVDSEGYSEWTLWTLMGVFGAYFKVGTEGPFIDNTIYLREAKSA